MLFKWVKMTVPILGQGHGVIGVLRYKDHISFCSLYSLYAGHIVAHQLPLAIFFEFIELFNNNVI